MVPGLRTGHDSTMVSRSSNPCVWYLVYDSVVTYFMMLLIQSAKLASAGLVMVTACAPVLLLGKIIGGGGTIGAAVFAACPELDDEAGGGGGFGTGAVCFGVGAGGLGTTGAWSGAASACNGADWCSAVAALAAAGAGTRLGLYLAFHSSMEPGGNPEAGAGTGTADEGVVFDAVRARIPPSGTVIAPA